MVVTRGEWDEVVKGAKGVNYTAMEDLILGGGTQCNVQIMNHRNLHLKPIIYNLINITPTNSI